MKRRGILCGLLLISFTFVFSTNARVQPSITNVWTKSSGGNWDDATAWSAGQLPTSTHWVAITNSGAKTVEIDSQTAQNFPSSLSISDLVVANNNTLFFNHVGATFQVDPGTNIWNGLEVSKGSKLLNIESDLNIKGLLRIASGEFLQDGGSVEAATTTYIHGGGVYRLTNGVFNAGYFELPSGGTFHQYGGTFSASTSLRVSQFSNFYLHGGQLILPTSADFLVHDWSTFTQDGGTVRVTGLHVTGSSGEAAYLMDGGECYVNNLNVFAALAHANFEQAAGLVAVTNTLTLSGSARYYPPHPILGAYILGSNAVLRAHSLVMDDSYGFCAFETSGQATISGDFLVKGDPDYPADFSIRDGTFSCQNFRADGAVVDVDQTGGALNIPGVFSFTGYYPGVYNGINARPALYAFKGGTLTANRIDLAAEWVIGSSSQSHRITNSGQFSLAGTLRVGDAIEQFGRFILSNNATINLGDGHANLTFADSSAEQWNNSATLFITSWEGSPSGGGSDQLKFGNDNSALTTRELQQILFINPAGFQPGQYAAKILANGEIVPAVTPQLSVAANANNLVINWSDDRILQSSANVEGPYADLPTAKPPYQVDVTSTSQLFLRLRP